MACHVVIPAAGIGQRMGEAKPKQYLSILGCTLLEHSLRPLLASPALDKIVVVLQPDDPYVDALPLLRDERVLRAPGGNQRSDSVLNGLALLQDMASQDDWVLVHDAARPCVKPQDLDRLLSAVLDSGVGGLLAEPVRDTVKRADQQAQVTGTLDRNGLWRAQTPQMFRLGQLAQALNKARQDRCAVTDEAMAMEQAGYPVQLVEGSPTNIKVTVPDDLALAQFYLSRSYEGQTG
ncbi:MAG: 2-C-methyl-D-erythritol 4-phosphate cytidylyltransferase [Halioglobus sp.]